MVLDFLNHEIEYSRFLQLLKIQSYGAPAGNIRHLAQLGLSVTYSVTDIDGLYSMLDGGMPVIVFLRTKDLPYWSHQTDHAVVVVGYEPESQTVYLNDPYFDQAAIGVSRDLFELAWLERDYFYAVVSQAE